MIPIIDTHVHFWDQSVPGLSWPWLEKGFKSARHSWTEAERRSNSAALEGPRYTAQEFREESKACGIAGLVHAHAATAADDPSTETRWLDAMAALEGWPLAIIGRGDLTSSDGPALLRRHREASDRCRSVRDMKGPEGLDPDACAATLQAAAELGFSVELRTPPEGFGVLAALADRHPNVTFVLSHAALPRERSPATLALWKEAATMLAAQPNWVCKISALCGGSDPNWTVSSIRPWADACLEVFGPPRCMLGCNWPVDRLFGSYRDVIAAYREIFSGLSEDEQVQLFHRTALKLYGIPDDEICVDQ